ANSNQMMLELMGLQLPGSSFVNPDSPLRDLLTIEATRRALRHSAPAGGTLTMADTVDERSIVNAIVGLLATGGSTNHTIHIVAMAFAAGILVNWDDFNDLSAVVPLLARSEEHTSELQSRENLVCRLLLEKKNRARRTQTRA